MAWTTPRTWTPGELVTALMMNQHVRDNLNDLNGRAVVPWSPTWTNIGGTAHTTGNGVYSAGYWRMGSFVYYRLHFTWGSTTASGTGLWAWTLPVPADALITAFGATGYAFDSSTGLAYPLTVLPSGASQFYAVVHTQPVSGVSPTNPITWANGDTFQVAGFYIAA